MSETKTDRLCRTCMNDSNSHSPIYREPCLEDSMLFEVINDVCQLEVTEGDGLPECICHDCFAKLSEFQKFKCRAHEVNVILQRMKEHKLKSESESVLWESCKTEDESNFEQENDVLDLGSKELCGRTLALHHDWIKPEYSTSDHEQDDVNPAGVDKVEADVKSEFSNGNASYCGSSNLMQPNEESVADPDDDHLSYPVKVEPEDSFDEASDGRKDTPYEEYIGIDPDDLACNAVRFDGTTLANTDPLQVPVNVTELKQESFSAERCHPTKLAYNNVGFDGTTPATTDPLQDTFHMDGLKKEDLSTEAMPVEVSLVSDYCTSADDLDSESEDCSSECNLEDVHSAMRLNFEGTLGKRYLERDGMPQRIQNESAVKVSKETADTENRSSDYTKEIGEQRRITDVCTYKGRVRRKTRNINEKVTDQHPKSSNDSGCREFSNKSDCPKKSLKDSIASTSSRQKVQSSDKKTVVKPGLTPEGSDSHGNMDTNRFFCDMCRKGFHDKYRLVPHIWLHIGFRPYKCSICSKSFLTKYYLQRHNSVHKKGLKQYSCSVCKMSFRLEMNLNDHIRRHDKLVMYKCPKCDKGFPLKSRLRFHMRSHSAKRPFKCTNCDMCFKWKQNLQNHMKISCKGK